MATPIDWAFCVAPKPLGEDNIVSNACLGASALAPAGVGATVAASTPSNGCALFGPEVSSPGLRPRDPDGTGGYYQPLRADLPGADTAFALVRIQCSLTEANATAATAFAAAYRPNDNPQILPLTASIQGRPVALTAIPAGSHVTLQASWPATSAETFAYFDRASQTVTTLHESMQIAWYSSEGALDTESTGRASDDLETTTENGWAAPASGGTIHLWVILRDSRGGVDYSDNELVVVK
jgi:hypothetical protein